MSYLLKRLALFLPTLLLIIGINFAIIQTAPSGPVEQKIAQIEQESQALSTQHFGVATYYQGGRGLSDEMVQELTVRYGFDKPVIERFWLMLSQYARLDLGNSFFKGQSVIELIKDKLPATMLLGALSLIVMYGMGVALGLYKAMAHDSWVDKVSTLILALCHALPVFVLALALLVVFAGSAYWQIFAMQGVVSDGFAGLTWWGKVKDLAYHMTLPVLSSSLGSVAGIAYLVKYQTLAQLNMPYVLCAKARGFGQYQILYGQIFKNVLLPVASQLPMAVAGLLFSGNFLVEIIFNIDGLGRLGYEAVMLRDYPVVFGLLFVFTVVSMVVQLIFDMLYQWLDPRIDLQA